MCTLCSQGQTERRRVAHPVISSETASSPSPISGTNLLLTLAFPALKCGGKDLEDAVILALVWAKLPEQKKTKQKCLN